MTTGIARSPAWWRKHGSIRHVNPRKVRSNHSASDENAVQRYMRSPNAGHTPCFILYPNGTYWACDGVHHTEAARRKGRKVRARVVTLAKHEENIRAESGGCLFLILTFGLYPYLLRRRA
jgi:hypothetical protein